MESGQRMMGMCHALRTVFLKSKLSEFYLDRAQ